MSEFAVEPFEFADEILGDWSLLPEEMTERVWDAVLTEEGPFRPDIIIQIAEEAKAMGYILPIPSDPCYPKMPETDFRHLEQPGATIENHPRLKRALERDDNEAIEAYLNELEEIRRSGCQPAPRPSFLTCLRSWLFG